MLRLWLCAAFGLSVLIPAGAGAARFEVEVQAPARPLAGLVRVAGIGDIEDPSTRRRISFYADKVLAAMNTLAEEDARIADGSAEPSSDVLDGFRNAMLRFVEASMSAGLEADKIAEVLAEAYDDRYEGAEPIQLLDSEGKLEASSLVATSMGFRRFGEAVGTKPVDYLAAVSTEGSKVREDRLSRLSETGEAPPEQEVAGLTPQTIEAEAVEEVEDVVEAVDPVIASIRDRITYQGSERVLTVQRGDTLGLIARALYGDSLLYRTIFSNNRDVLSNPDNLRVGVVLRIPES